MSASPSIQDMFFEECQELLEALTDGLTEMQGGDDGLETVNSVFRAVHSIKGGAGAFGLDALVSFAHIFETVLDDLRSDKLAQCPDLIDLFLRSSDFLADLIDAAQNETSVDEDQNAKLVAELEAYTDSESAEEEIVFQPMALDMSMDFSEQIATTATYQILFRPHEKLYQNGHEPLFLFQALAHLGKTDITLDESDVPHLSEFETGQAYLRWVIVLESDQGPEKIEEVFEFVEGLCDLTITQQHEDPTVMPDVGPLPPLESDGGADDIAAPPPLAKPVASVTPVEERAPESKSPRPTLRVDPERVDRLINTVGELIINQAILTQHIMQIDHRNLRDIENQLEDYKLLARDLQEDVMAIRAQPVKPLFQRMSRIVREAATATGKSARLIMDGEGTEVDKTLIERLADPLTHMIRNAVDHGLETPEGRRAAGKDDVGEIRLRAAHRSGSVFISISDDGAGLNRAKIYEIAVAKQLIPAGTELQPSEIDNLLFLPGFSTATEVSNLSGRGVGMDVVKNAVTALGGRVSIHSEPGEGTTFSIVLPLTLAVMDGMVIIVENETMVVPITSIIETIRPDPDKVYKLGADGPVYQIRGTYVPIIDVAWKLALSDAPFEGAPKVLLLVETEGLGQCALAVDDIRDQRQVVIKSLDGVYSGVMGVSAATILGDGKIAMIIDAESVVQIEQSPAKVSQAVIGSMENENELAS